ncbi:hypothetical protein LTR62_007363 [Meristemomyces frigidus]|uniref:DUF7918 domain-containing protein n=1 Tax=Meristemomyces frigidus TaxID=1508187 RepID=A0AAN7YT67_9PEZI|nr:hypothetical protein LTR62_007363 [Meristemomyces frigidus]
MVAATWLSSDAVPGLNVTIFVDGSPVQEHRDGEEVDEGQEVTRWVEAKDGKNFEVRMKATERLHFKGDSILCHVYVDGDSADRPIIGKSTLRNLVSAGRQFPGGLVQQYRFACLETGKLD